MTSNTNDGFIAAIVQDAHQFMVNLGVGVPAVPPCLKGSQRFQTVFDTHEQLVHVRNILKPKNWDTTAVNRRDGEFLIATLWGFKQDLDALGEGFPRPQQQHT